MRTLLLSKGQVKSLTLEQVLGYSREGSFSQLGVVSAYSESLWAYRCINLRAQAISGVPLKMTRADDDWPDHPLNILFAGLSSRLLWQLEAGLCIWGRAYLEPVKNRLGQVVQLRWLNPQITQPQIGLGGITGFYHTPTGGQAVTFAPEELIYMHLFNPADDLGAVSPLLAALGAVNIDQDTRRYAQAFFNNGARLDGLLTIPDASNDQIDAVEAKWKKIFKGVRNAFKTMIVGGQGISYTPIASLPKDTALTELRAEQRRDICAAFGVPPTLAGAWEAANYASAGEARKSFYTETVLPELDFIEDELNRQFVLPYWPEARLKFDLAQIEALREDEKTRNEGITIAYQGGWMTLNEARGRADLPELSVSAAGAMEAPAGNPFQSYP